MIAVIGGVQAAVRIDMTMPKAPDPKEAGAAGISPWEREAYGEGGRFGSMQMMPSGDPSKDRISVRYSGCAYQVARHLAEKGRQVAFLSVVGEDPLGLAAVGDLARAGIDTSGIVTIDHFLAEANAEAAEDVGPDAAGTVANGLIRQSLTSIQVEARNFLGDVEFFREDRRMQDEIRPQLLSKGQPLLEGAELVFADGGLPMETLLWISEICRKSEIPFYFDPASVPGGRRGADLLGAVDGIMPGRQEAEAMSDLQILSPDQLMAAGAYFAEKGVTRTVITMKGGGLYYKEGTEEGILRPPRVLRFSETVGAGDVVTAQLLHAYAQGLGMEAAAQSAMEEAARYLSDCVDQRRY